MTIARVQGPPEHVLELEPLHYQVGRSPDSTHGFDWDANWVVVRIAVRDGDRRWSCVDPAFLTTELQELVIWLRAVAAGDPVELAFNPMEPLLGFEVQSGADDLHLRATFELELELELEPPEGDAWLDFRPGRDALRQFADDLAAATAPFPKR